MNNKIINGDEVKIGRIAFTSNEKKLAFENWDFKIEQIILSPYMMQKIKFLKSVKELQF